MGNQNTNFNNRSVSYLDKSNEYKLVYDFAKQNNIRNVNF